MNLDEIKKAILGQVQKIGQDFHSGVQAIAPQAQNAYNTVSNAVSHVQPQQAFQALTQPLGQTLIQTVTSPQFKPVIGQMGKVAQQVPTIQEASPSLGGSLYNFGVAQPINSYGRTFERYSNNQLFQGGAGNAIEDFINLASNPIANEVTAPLLKAGGKVAMQAIDNPEVKMALSGQAGKIQLGPKIKVASSEVKVPTKAGPLNQFFDRTRNVIASQGPAGKELADRLKASRDTAEIMAGNWVSQLPTVRSLSGKEFENFVDVAEGNTQPISEKVAKAVSEWGNVRTQVYNTAKQAGLDIGQVENYFPHRYDPKMFEGDNFVKAVDHLVQTGQATTSEEAAKLLRYAQDTVRNRRQGNLEVARLVNLPGYEKTKDALFNYLEQAGHRIGQVQNLGQDDSVAMQLINTIGDQGGDAAAAKEAFDIAAGAKKYSESSKAVSGTLRKIQSTTKLGLGAITNTGQSINTATVTGTMRTLMSMKKAFSPEAQDFSLRAGTTLDGVLNDVREGGGFTGKVLGKLTAPGFNNVEKFNRVVASWAGKGYGEELARQALKGSKSAYNQLSKMGIDPEAVIARGGQLSFPEQIIAARNIVERTQFKVDPQDLPGWASSPYGKLFAQFKNFSYNQTAFVKREILDPATKGNLMPLLRYLAIGAVAGEAIGDVKAFVRGRDREQNPVKRLADNINTVGGAGIAADIYNAASRGPQGVLQFIGGPTAGEVSKLVGGAGLALQGKPKTLAKTLISDIPIAGQTISNVVFPPKNVYSSRTPDLPLEQASAADFPAGSIVSADSLQNPDLALPDSTLTPLQQADIKKKISDLQKQEKEILNKNGFSLPYVGQIGGLDSNQKNQQLSQLDLQINNFQEQLKSAKLPNIDLSQYSKIPTSATAKAKLDVQRFKDAKEVLNSTLPEDQKMALYKKIGIDPQDVTYFDNASQNDNIKSIFVREQLSNFQGDHQALLQQLVEWRKEVNGKMLLSDGVISDLVEQGLVSKEEGTVLKKVQYNKDLQGKYKVKMTGRGSGAKLKKISLAKLPLKGINLKKTSSKNTQLQLKSPKITMPQVSFATPFDQNYGIPKVPDFKSAIKFNV